MTVVLLHPVGLDGAAWQFLPDELLNISIQYTVLGHGDRSDSIRGLGLRDLARDVVETLEGDLDLVGWSMGGAVAQHIALNWPDRTRSLLLACTSAGEGGGSSALEHAHQVESLGLPGIVESTMSRWFTPSALSKPGHAGVEYARQRLLTDSAESFASSWRAMAENDAFRKLEQIRARTTVLHTEQDSAGTAAARRSIADRIPNSRFVSTPGSHMLQLEDPLAAAQVISEHLHWARSGG